jgi:hypothetical protein
MNATNPGGGDAQPSPDSHSASQLSRRRDLPITNQTTNGDGRTSPEVREGPIATSSMLFGRAIAVAHENKKADERND